AVLDAVGDRLYDRRRLAGAWASQHQQRAALVVDHPLLRVVEKRPGGCSLRPPDKAVGGLHQYGIPSEATDIFGGSGERPACRAAAWVRVNQAARPPSQFCQACVSVDGSRSSK